MWILQQLLEIAGLLVVAVCAMMLIWFTFAMIAVYWKFALGVFIVWGLYYSLIKP